MSPGHVAEYQDPGAEAQPNPEAEEGVLFAFRQEDCAEAELTLNLPFAEDGSVWLLRDADTGEELHIDGAEARDGFALTFDKPRTARMFTLRSVR